MTRFPSCIVAIALSGAPVLFASPAFAQSSVQIAAKENDEGKALMFERRYKEASAKFRSAASRSPDPKYFFNLCASEYQQNALSQAMDACRAAGKLNPDPVLKAKIAKLETKIKSDADAQHIDLGPPEGGPTAGGGGSSGGASGATAGGPSDGSSGANQGSNVAGSGGASTSTGAATSGGASTSTGAATSGGAGNSAGGGSASGTNVQTGANAYPPAVQPRKPAQDLFVEAKPEHAYTWTFGADLFGGRGTMGDASSFGDVVGGIRLRSDYLINPKAKFGSQFYFQGTAFGSGDHSLTLFDTGVALYKHFCGTTRLCLTPLAGAHFTLMNPSTDSASDTSQVFNYVGVGARLEGNLSYSLGRRLEHVISVAIDANLYTRALSDPMNGITARSWGLDHGGSTVSLSFGYTYRFNTPAGQVPFLSLE